MHPAVALAEVSTRQHGVVTTAQLHACGFGRAAITHRVETRQLVRLHRGVYRVGPNQSPLAAATAAVLACGPEAVLSHRSAAALHGFGKWGGPIEVTGPTHRRHKEGVRVHEATLEEWEVTRVEGLLVTTPLRTIRDLAAETSRDELERTIAEAQIQRKLNRPSLTSAVDQHAGRRGAVALRAAASEGPSITRSKAERLLLGLVRQAGLPQPETNITIGRYEVDALWRDRRLIVEVDGFAVHGTRRAFERDRAKDAELVAQGFRVIRITWRQLVDEPHLVVARLAVALSRG